MRHGHAVKLHVHAMTLRRGQGSKESEAVRREMVGWTDSESGPRGGATSYVAVPCVIALATAGAWARPAVRLRHGAPF